MNLLFLISKKCSLIELLAIFRSGGFNGMFFLTNFFWNNVCLVFFTFNDNLLPMNQRLIFSSSIFTIEKKCCVIVAQKKEVCVISKHDGIIQFRNVWKIIYINQNSKGPNIEPRGTPQVMSTKAVVLQSYIMFCFRFLR